MNVKTVCGARRTHAGMNPEKNLGLILPKEKVMKHVEADFHTLKTFFSTTFCFLKC